ncbi:MAG: transposase [Bacteroidota bacterium]|nr:transposase [Bacteroidota bacterium]
MRKKYLFLIIFSILFIAAITATRKSDVESPRLKMRDGNIVASSEWVNTKNAIETLENDLRRNPDNNEIKLKLTQAYIQEGRITGDHNYYDALAFSLVNEVLKSDEGNFEALCCKATLQASAHQFSDALQTSQVALKINPYNAYIYGIMCDAYVELGKYKEAINSGDKMVSIRPDIRSYSRISYLREITGDYPGAIEAMKMALNAGVPGMEQTEWARTYLGKLYEITGQPEMAKSLYSQALVHRPYFAPALAGLGRIERSMKNYDQAIINFKSAAENMQDYSFHQELATTYQLSGKNQQAEKEFQIALDMLMKHKHPTSEEFGIGHHIDRELALVYLSVGEYESALNSARAEYERRPTNIDVNEVLAWSFYKTGNSKAAFTHILKAMSTKSNNAELLYKAGIIFAANQKPNLAKMYRDNALKINPFLDTNLLSSGNPGLAFKQ